MHLTSHLSGPGVAGNHAESGRRGSQPWNETSEGLISGPLERPQDKGKEVTAGSHHKSKAPLEAARASVTTPSSWRPEVLMMDTDKE